MSMVAVRASFRRFNSRLREEATLSLKSKINYKDMFQLTPP